MTHGECTDCAYYRARRTRQCRHPHAVQALWLGDGMRITVVPPAIRNQDHDCEDFRRQTMGRLLVNHLDILLGLYALLMGLRVGLYYVYGWLGLR